MKTKLPPRDGNQRASAILIWINVAIACCAMILMFITGYLYADNATFLHWLFLIVSVNLVAGLYGDANKTIFHLFVLTYIVKGE